MSVERRRACGYRKVGGLYLVSGGPAMPCCKLPIILHVCPTCHGGIKQARGWQWIDPRPFLAGDCTGTMSGTCPAATANQEVLGERVGLIWIGTAFYPSPTAFIEEARSMGISRRITAVPRNFRLGKTWVFLAHPKVRQVINEAGKAEWQAGVFRMFKPERIEKIITESQLDDEREMAKLREAGITPVAVPDDDADHRGSVYDDTSEPAFL